MNLLVENRQNNMDIGKELFEEVLKKASEVLKLNVQLEISLVLTNNEEIQQLNREYRGIDKATDVLSFPLLDLDPSNRDVWLSRLEDNLIPGSGEVMLGDIVISVEKAKEQAEEYNHGIKRELAFLFIHGLLHLLGYDHEKGQKYEQIMNALQEEILLQCNLPRI